VETGTKSKGGSKYASGRRGWGAWQVGRVRTSFAHVSAPWERRACAAEREEGMTVQEEIWA